MATSADWSSLRRITPRVLWRVVIVVAAALIVAFESRALFVLFGGVLLAVFLKTLAEIVARYTRIPYVVAVVGLVVLHLGVAVAVVVAAGPNLVDQASTLMRTLPAAFGQAFVRARQILGTGSKLPLPRIEDLRPEAKSVVAGASGAVTGTVEVVAGLVVAAFVGVYGALAPSAYTRIALALVPQERQARAREVLYETGRRLGRWLLGRAVAMAFVGAVTALGLHLLHVPLAVSLGILAGVLAFVEYIGAVASAVPPILIALGDSPTRALGVVLLFTGVHAIEGYLLTPWLARKAVHFPPAYTLAAQTLFGAVFGAMGLTFATPTCIVAVTLVEMLYVQDVLGKRTV